MKRELNINTVRVFLFYDHEYRAWGQLGFTDGKGTFNDARLQTVSRFIDLAGAEGLDVVPTLFMEMETLEHGGFDWTTLETNYGYHEAYARWVTRMLAAKANVHGVNLKNEPDGFGAWADPEVAGRILTWMGRLKQVIKDEAPHLGVYVNSAAFDNTFKKFEGAPVGHQSIYDLSDALFFNSYLWADNGFWPYAVPATIYRYISDHNIARKPMVLSELGWPSYNDDSGMIVPGMQWDLPLGLRPTTPSTPEMQKRAVEESVYWAEKYGFSGLIAWAAYDHVPGAYRNPFGLIDGSGRASAAAAVFAQAFTNQYSSQGEAPVSLVDGQVTDGKINGLNGTTPLPAGVNLDAGGSYASQPLRYANPVSLAVKFRQPRTPTHDGVAVGITSAATTPKVIQLRREEHTKVWRLFINNSETARSRPDAGLGTAPVHVRIELANRAVTFQVNGSALTLYSVKNGGRYSLTLTAGEVTAQWRLTAAASTAAVELLEARAHGTAGTRYSP
ncbi:hypothetical protein [Deinococcus malanensis]|nr:hypothetical protein [Deinococcus malanensis]